MTEIALVNSAVTSDNHGDHGRVAGGANPRREEFDGVALRRFSRNRLQNTKEAFYCTVYLSPSQHSN